MAKLRTLTCSWGRIAGILRLCNSPCDMKGLSAAMFVACHACSRSSFALTALFLTDVACLDRKKKSPKILHIQKAVIIVYNALLHGPQLV